MEQFGAILSEMINRLEAEMEPPVFDTAKQKEDHKAEVVELMNRLDMTDDAALTLISSHIMNVTSAFGGAMIGALAVNDPIKSNELYSFFDVIADLAAGVGNLAKAFNVGAAPSNDPRAIAVDEFYALMIGIRERVQAFHRTIDNLRNYHAQQRCQNVSGPQNHGPFAKRG